jgi:endoglucanase
MDMKNLITIFLIVISFGLTAQPRKKAFEINEKLGRGINYGNMFESPSEGAWGNQWQPEYAKIIADLGFNHVRIPVRWEPAGRSLEKQPYTIYPSFFKSIKQVMDSALNSGLYVVLNMHHHDALYKDPEGQKERFLKQWEQISDFFKDYPETLVFEILNEPHDSLTADKWNEFIPEALEVIRKKNPERIVMIGTANWGGLGGLPHLKIPDDPNIILTIHYYNPFHFTHQGASWSGERSKEWLGTTWDDTEEEREAVRKDFAPLIALEKEKNIPVHIGEFGAYQKADMESRIKWTTFLTRYFEQLDWSWAYWEFSAGFGIYNPESNTFKQELVDALLHNKMPEPTE